MDCHSCHLRQCFLRDFVAGDPIKEIFLLTEGRVKIVKESKSGSETRLRWKQANTVLCRERGQSAAELMGGVARFRCTPTRRK
jgi:CRP-like cAMP-binding protein